VLAFVGSVCTLILNILSTTSPDWLVLRSPEVVHSRVTFRYGLVKRCELREVKVPGDDNGEYTNYVCRDFPMRVADGCEKENKVFCALWTSAGYVSEIGVGFAAMALIALIIGVSTHSRRRRIWRAVAGLILFHAIFQLIAFIIVTDLYRTGRYAPFEHAKIGTGYVLNTVSWIAGLLIGVGVITTGISADKGAKWAAGNRAYRPIEG